MPIPDFQTLMLPFLRELSDRRERSMREVTDALADQFQLTEGERAELIGSKRAPLFYNRVAWTKTHLKNAGLIENSQRGRVSISDEGIKVLAEKPSRINMKFLGRYPSYANFSGKAQIATELKLADGPVAIEQQSPPDEVIAAA